MPSFSARPSSISIRIQDLAARSYNVTCRRLFLVELFWIFLLSLESLEDLHHVNSCVCLECNLNVGSCLLKVLSIVIDNKAIVLSWNVILERLVTLRLTLQELINVFADCVPKCKAAIVVVLDGNKLAFRQWIVRSFKVFSNLLNGQFCNRNIHEVFCDLQCLLCSLHLPLFSVQVPASIFVF